MPDMKRTAWIDAFVTYVLREKPRASASRLAEVADALFSKFGEYEADQVAEAEWSTLPLADS